MVTSRVRRRVLVAVVIIGVLGTTAVLVRRYILHDAARVVGTDEAIDRYRATTTTVDSTVPSTGPSTVPATAPPPSSRPTTTAPAALTLPAPGVYRLATTGSESIDVLGGASHSYPAQTLLTVTQEGCGVRLRWDVLKERREEWVLCVSDIGIELRPEGAFQYHEFFGTGELEPVTCDQAVPLVPADGKPRSAVALDCTLAQDVWRPSWEVLDSGTRTIDGAQVPVIHVRMSVENDSEYYEHTVIDWWLDEHGLPLEMSTTKVSNSHSDLIGNVVYHETYDVTLESLTPLQ